MLHQQQIQYTQFLLDVDPRNKRLKRRLATLNMPQHGRDALQIRALICSSTTITEWTTDGRTDRAKIRHHLCTFHI